MSHSTIAPSTALDLARNGATVAWEGCGCGGGGGCEIEWFDAINVHAMAATGRPQLGKSKTSITWIDVWSSAETTVAFAHGDVRWGDFMA